jgi:hypothetical protein
VSSPLGWLLLALVFMLGLLAYLAYASYRQAVEDAATSTRNLVQVLESHLSNDLTQTSDVLAFLARRISEADLRPTLSAREQSALTGQLADLEIGRISACCAMIPRRRSRFRMPRLRAPPGNGPSSWRTPCAMARAASSARSTR